MLFCLNFGGTANYAYQLFLERPFSELAAFASYADGLSPNGTHQGLKGLEFPRAMAVTNDEEAGGPLFSYDKLLGVKEPTKTDRDNERVGKDNALACARRLLYLTCSRAEKSFAMVVYPPQPTLAKRNVVLLAGFRRVRSKSGPHSEVICASSLV